MNSVEIFISPYPNRQADYPHSIEVEVLGQYVDIPSRVISEKYFEVEDWELTDEAVEEFNKSLNTNFGKVYLERVIEKYYPDAVAEAAQYGDK